MGCEDKNWLEEKYLTEKLDMKEIADLVGCCYGTVQYWMKKHGIPRRSNSESKKLVASKELTDRPLYTDREWLYACYWNDGLDMVEMGAMAGCGVVTILRWMERYGIPRRSKSDAGKKSWDGNEDRRERFSKKIKAAWAGGSFDSPEHKELVSRNAKRRWADGLYSGDKHPRWRKDSKVVECDLCGKEIRRPPNRSSWEHFFCSNKCRLEWVKRGNETVVCASCGKELSRPRNRIERNAAHFCSAACHGEWRSVHPGEGTGNWRGGISFEPYPITFNRPFKRKIRERDRYRCAICRLPGRHVHHINYVKKDTNPTNCITLCKHCHAVTNGNRAYWQSALSAIMEARTEIVPSWFDPQRGVQLHEFFEHETWL